MGVVVGRDGGGLWASVECDERRCWTAVTVRPRLLELLNDSGVDELVAWAARSAWESGWRVEGQTYCPRHQFAHRPRAKRTIGEGYIWAEVVKDPTLYGNAALRPS